MLENLEELYLGHREELVGEIPLSIGNLSALRVLDLTRTRIRSVPSTISMLSCLLKLDLTWCDEIGELPELPASLVCLHVKSHSLQSVPNLSNLTNLEELILYVGSKYQYERHRMQTCDVVWIGRLTKLKKLNLCFFNVAALPAESGLLSHLQELSLTRVHLQHLRQLPPSLLCLVLEFFEERSLELNLRSLYTLIFCECRHLGRIFVPSSVRTLEVSFCPEVIEIQFLGASGFLEELTIKNCMSFERIGCNEVGAVGVDKSESSSELTVPAPVVLLLANTLKNLRELQVSLCRNLLEIRVIGTLLSLRDFSVGECQALEKLSGISNLRNLRRLYIYKCSRLQVVEGLNELECLNELTINNCSSLETFVDILKAKIQDMCLIQLHHCKGILDSLPESHITFKRFRKMILLQREQHPDL